MSVWAAGGRMSPPAREASSKDAATRLGPGKGGPPSIILKGTGLEERVTEAENSGRFSQEARL